MPHSGNYSASIGLQSSEIRREACVREVQSVTHGSRLAEMSGRMAVGAGGPGEPEGRLGLAAGASPMGEIAKNEVPHGPDSDFLELPNKKKLRRPMEQSNNVRKRSGGKHFTYEDRIRLETLDRTLYPGKKRPNLSELARRLGRHRSSVSREYRRATVMNKNTQLEEFPVYSAAKGEAIARKAALEKGPRGKLTNKIAADIAGLIIEEKLSPYAALVRLRNAAQHPWLPCERTVYYAIDAGLLGVSRQQLPYKRAAKPKKKTGRRMAYTNARGRSITERPPDAEDRRQYGHWEMDTVVGGTGTSPACLLVLTERMSRQEIIRKIPSRTQDAVKSALDCLERGHENIFKTMKSLTCDNGCEFLNPESIESSTLHRGSRCALFFAHPYRSSERGSNENANRIVRRFVPKGADISGFSKKKIQNIEDWINSLPRKILDDLSADEKVEQYFKKEAA
jgi:IS30 family transposase